MPDYDIFLYNPLNQQVSVFQLDEEQAQMFCVDYADCIYFFATLTSIEYNLTTERI